MHNISALLSCLVVPDHIDSHHHVHMFKQIFPIVAEFAQQKALPIRVDRLLAQKKILILKGY